VLVLLVPVAVGLVEADTGGKEEPQRVGLVGVGALEPMAGPRVPVVEGERGEAGPGAGVERVPH